MKNKNNIDELFKSKLEERVFDIKPEFLDQLNDQLDARAKGKRKKYIYLSAGLVLLLFAVLVGALLISNDEATEQAQINQKYIDQKASGSNTENTKSNSDQSFKNGENGKKSTQSGDDSITIGSNEGSGEEGLAGSGETGNEGSGE
ncbi:MAG: hypothetical protein HRT57_03960, partial [Crocinitomicaceae bacterium]|nr:hypothetical protein [Crocinitomicaceae bacterium]